MTSEMSQDFLYTILHADDTIKWKGLYYLGKLLTLELDNLRIRQSIKQVQEKIFLIN